MSELAARSRLEQAQEGVRRARSALFSLAASLLPEGTLVPVRCGDSRFTLEILRWFPRPSSPTSPGVSARVQSIQKLDAEHVVEGQRVCSNLDEVMAGTVSGEAFNTRGRHAR